MSDPLDGLRERVAATLLCSWTKGEPTAHDRASASQDADAVLAVVREWDDHWRGQSVRELDRQVAALRRALRELVDLKDGPRDSAYYERKPLAWDAARAALGVTDE